MQKDKGKGTVDESGHENGQVQIVDVEEISKVAEKGDSKEDKGKGKMKSKAKDFVKGDKGDVKVRRSTSDLKVDEGSKASPGTKAPATTAKDEKGKEKETRSGRRKGKSSAEASPTTELSVSPSSPPLAGPSTDETSRSTPQRPRAHRPHSTAPGMSKRATTTPTQEDPEDSGDTDMEESDSSYYTVRKGYSSSGF